MNIPVNSILHTDDDEKAKAICKKPIREMTEEEREFLRRRRAESRKEERAEHQQDEPPPPPPNDDQAPPLEPEDDEAPPRPPEDDGLFQLLDMDDIFNAPDPEFLIEGHVYEKSTVVVFGPPKHYKSFLVQDMALSVAYGFQWMGKQVKQGNVVYIAAEGQGGIKKRIKAWMQYNKVERTKAFKMLPEGVDVAIESIRKKLINTIHLMKPKLIIIDTLSRSMKSGKENDAGDVTKFMDACTEIQQKTGATVLLVHHSGKDPEKGGRGSSAIQGTLDTEISVTKSKCGKYVTAKCTAQKDAAEFGEISMIVQPVEDSIVLVRSMRLVPTVNFTPTQQEIVRVLKLHKDGIDEKDLREKVGGHRNAWAKNRDGLIESGYMKRENGLCFYCIPVVEKEKEEDEDE